MSTGTPATLEVELIGSHSLWVFVFFFLCTLLSFLPCDSESPFSSFDAVQAHCLWNAGVYFARYLDEHKEIVQGKW